MENEGHLVGMEVTQGCPPVVSRVPLVQWLVQQLQVLSRQTIVAGLKKVRIIIITLELPVMISECCYI